MQTPNLSKQGNNRPVADGDDRQSVWFVWLMDQNVTHVEKGATHLICNDSNEWGGGGAIGESGKR